MVTGKYMIIRHTFGRGTNVIAVDQGQWRHLTRVSRHQYDSAHRRETLAMVFVIGTSLAKRVHAESDIVVQKEETADTSTSLCSDADIQHDDADSDASDTKREIMQIENTMRTRSLVDSMWQSLE